MINIHSAERKVERAKIFLSTQPKFALWSGALFVGKHTIVDDPEMTACTNGVDDKYGRQFIESLTDKQVRYVVLHETMHKLFKHLRVYRSLFKKNADVANQACDYVGNLELEKADPRKEFIEMPTINGIKVGLLDWRFDNMSSDKVFDILYKEQAQNDGGESEGTGGFDSHDWEGAGNMSSEEWEKAEKDIETAVQQGKRNHEKLHGKGSAKGSMVLNELLDPKINWVDVLAEFISTNMKGRDATTWARPNRRFVGAGEYMPSSISRTMQSVALCGDTSGSMYEDMTRSMSEAQAVISLCQPEQVDVLFWDSAVTGHEVYKSREDTDLYTKTKPTGGGGTDPNCIPAYMKDKQMTPQCAVVITDGYFASWGEWDVPVLWCVIGNKKAIAPVGQTVHIDN